MSKLAATLLALVSTLGMASVLASSSLPDAAPSHSLETMTPPIRHTVRFPDPGSHYAEIEALIPTGGAESVEMMMAVWTPGSYLVREYAQQIDALSASGAEGTARVITKTAKNRWRIATGGDTTLRLSYRLYCHRSSVRNNWVDENYAFLVGAATFLTPVGDLDRPHEVTVELPAGWRQAVSSLDSSDPSAPAKAGSNRVTFRARNFDQLIDSPLYAGTPTLHRYEAGGVPHLLLNEGEGSSWDGPRSAQDAQRIAEQLISFWGSVPYPRYLLMNLITEGRGGLEHKNSAVLMTSRWATRTRESYLNWLGLVSHEQFHAWNGKRLRPVALGPFDYEHEVYTRQLWVVEGITSYYGDLLVRRAGLSTRKEYLKELSKTIDRLQTTPGRLVQPLVDASFDAWIKHYRRDENSVNSGVSYYSKGALVAWLLDARLRRASQAEPGLASSLDSVLRAAFERYSGERGYSEEEFRALIREQAGTASEEIGSFLHQALETTEELDFTPALDWFGLRFKTDADQEGAKDESADSGWLGIKTRVEKGRLLVDEVRRDTPAFTASLTPNDEILALDGYRVTAESWKERLESYRPGQAAELLVARRQRLVRVPVRFGREEPQRWTLEIDPAASAVQQQHLAAWLGDTMVAEPIRQP